MPAQRRSQNRAWLQGVLLLLLAALIGLALASHTSENPLCGPLADALADRWVGWVGPIAAWGLFALLPPIAVAWILGRPKRGILVRFLPFMPAVIVFSILSSPIDSLRGELGVKGLDLFKSILGPWGSWIVLAALALTSLAAIWRFAVPVSVRTRVDRITIPRPTRPMVPTPKRQRSKDRPAGPPDRMEPDLELIEAVPRIADGEGRVEETSIEPPKEPKIRKRKLTLPSPAVSHPAPRPVGEWKLPDVDLLSNIEGTRASIDRNEILETSTLVVQTLRDFGVQGKVGEVHPGPVVTRYEYEPAPGVRVSQIVSRIDDITLALRAESIRLVAPIPGKAAVGIEVPNRQPAMISLKEVLAGEGFRSAKGPLCLALGREISGTPVYTRLDKMPHLLVAGTTGSGKSVCLNGLLLSILFRHTPDDVRLLLIDPKRLELTPYDGIPALVCPVVTEARRAARMLEWLCEEMDRRYRVFQRVGAKGIEGYRQKTADVEEKEPMPYIVVVVDELADLMTMLRAEIEGPISRLAHMARAVGIHMIFATQRPSVDVLTGVVKANFPVRIAFKVASRIDSRTILDAGGAEFLLGRGDMLFLAPGKADAMRVHGAYCPEEDAERVAEFLRQQPPAPDLVPDEEESTVGSPARQDELFGDALRLVVQERQASVSFLQRRLKVGYSRAARLMDLLEAAGVVTPYDGSKARDLLVDESFLDDWDEREGTAGG